LDQVLLENAGPFSVEHVVVNGTVSCTQLHLGDWQFVSKLDIIGQLLPCFVMRVLKRTSFVLDDTCEAVHVIDSSGSSNLCSEAVSTNSCHGDLVFIHEADDVVGEILNARWVKQS
jgi:hypothetical protein